MKDKPRFFYGYVIAILSFLIMFLIIGLHPSLGIFFKPILGDFGWTRTAISSAFSLSIFLGGLAGIFIGGLNDRFGPRFVITLCGLLSAAGYLLMSQLQNTWQLYLFLGVLVGVGSNVFVPLLSTVARWFAQKRSMTTGIVYAGSGVGMLVLPLFINLLIQARSWRTTFLILGIILLVFIVLAAQFLKRDPGEVGQVAYGEKDVVGRVSDIRTKSFSFQEAIRNGQFWLFSIALFFYGFCVFSIQIHIAAHVTDLGISATDAAAVMATIGGASIAGQVGLGSIGDKIGHKRAFLIGTILLLISIVILISARELWTFYLFAVLFGLAYGNCGTQESPIAASLFGLASHGQIFGSLVFSNTIGCAVGPIVSGYIFDRTGSYQAAFILSAILSIVFIVLIAFLRVPSSKTAVEAE